MERCVGPGVLRRPVRRCSSLPLDRAAVRECATDTCVGAGVVRRTMRGRRSPPPPENPTSGEGVVPGAENSSTDEGGISLRPTKAVIPAAGLGTRFLPATKAQPKEMLPIVDTPIIQYVVREALQSGIHDILLVTGKNKRAIEDHFDRAPELENHLRENHKDDLLGLLQLGHEAGCIHYVRQPEPRGLGHAVLMARRHVGEQPFAVLLGDEVFVGDRPCLAAELTEVAQALEAPVVAVEQVPREEVSSYGVVAGKEVSQGLYLVSDLVEKPHPREAPSDLAIVGRYVLPPDVFPLLERQQPGYGGEIQAHGRPPGAGAAAAAHAYRPRCRRYDVGDKLGFLIATVEFALARQDLGPRFRAYLEGLMGREPRRPVHC